MIDIVSWGGFVRSVGVFRYLNFVLCFVLCLVSFRVFCGCFILYLIRLFYLFLNVDVVVDERSRGEIFGCIVCSFYSVVVVLGRGCRSLGLFFCENLFFGVCV